MIQISFFTFNPFQENTYLLTNEKGECIIIDPGCYFTAEQETLQQHIKHRGWKPVQLINTHCHLDHVFGNKWAAETYGLEMHIHPEEQAVFDMATKAGDKYGLSFSTYQGPIHYLHAGDTVSLGEDSFTILLTPGHSPGSICLYNAAQHFAISGDVLFRESIGRSDLPGGNHAQLINSIQTQLFTLPNDTIIYSGHGPSTTIHHEKMHNPFLI